MCFVPEAISTRVFSFMVPRIDSLLLVLLQHSVSVHLGSSNSLLDKVDRSRLKEPSNSNNAFCNCAQVIE